MNTPDPHPDRYRAMRDPVKKPVVFDAQESRPVAECPDLATAERLAAELNKASRGDAESAEIITDKDLLDFVETYHLSLVATRDNHGLTGIAYFQVRTADNKIGYMSSSPRGAIFSAMNAIKCSARSAPPREPLSVSSVPSVDTPSA